MAIIIKYPRNTKEIVDNFIQRKDKELTSLDWAKWAGWFDTDGCISTDSTKFKRPRARLILADREAVELFCKTFETTLRYHETKTTTPEPYRYHYIAKTYCGFLESNKASWFIKNIAKYMRVKKDKILKVMGYFDIEDYQLTNEEFLNYLGTVIDGDGCVMDYTKLNKKNKYTGRLKIEISSSNINFLCSIKNEIEKHSLCKVIGPGEKQIYKTKEGDKVKYGLYFYFSINPKFKEENDKNIEFLKVLRNYLTLSRKAKKINDFLEKINLN